MLRCLRLGVLWSVPESCPGHETSASITEQMRKLPFILVIFAAAVTAQAQNPYQFDNFDFANGVKVQTPPPPKVTPTKSPEFKKLVKPTIKYMPAPDALMASTPLNPSLNGFTTGNSEVDSYIVESGQKNQVDPLLLYSIMHQESSFKARAMSYKGARGLMQLMPPTAARFGVANIWEPKQNIEGGARYMRLLLDLFAGDVSLALAGYNAGECAVMKYGFRVPPYSETQEYVRRIGRRYSLIRDPEAAAHASKLTPEQAIAARERSATPLSVYEPTVYMARMPDGRLQLVSQ